MGTASKNKNGVKNSLVNNINARKKKGKSRPKKKSTVSKSAYKAMKNNWGKSSRKKTAKKATRAPKKTAKKKSARKTRKRPAK